MDVKVGDKVTVKGHSTLNASNNEFGADSNMKKMRGHSYKVDRVVEHGLQIGGYWFSFKDIFKEDTIDDKKSQIVKFDVEELSI